MTARAHGVAIRLVIPQATEFDEKSATFGLAPETLRKTNLRLLKAGDQVNVESSLKSGDRNSGHYVQGHVDGTGSILEKRFEKDSLWVRVKAPEEVRHGPAMAENFCSSSRRRRRSRAAAA